MLYVYCFCRPLSPSIRNEATESEVKERLQGALEGASGEVGKTSEQATAT